MQYIHEGKPLKKINALHANKSLIVKEGLEKYRRMVYMFLQWG
jgi:hypothetical protein